MENFIWIIIENSRWIYFVCLLAFSLSLFFYRGNKKNIKEALFGLELEVAQSRMRKSARVAIVCILVALMVFVVSNFYQPGTPRQRYVQATLTPNIFITPPPTFTNITPSPTATLTPTLSIPTTIPQLPVAGDEGTAQAEQEETETPTPTQEPAPGALCAINLPEEGGEVSGEVQVVGSAFADSFMFYKLEAYGPETGGEWASIIGDIATVPVINGVLGTANFTGWAPGGYSLRVIVVDDTSNEIAECFSSITVIAR